jgi:protein tyrosine/serine phosphatase
MAVFSGWAQKFTRGVVVPCAVVACVVQFNSGTVSAGDDDPRSNFQKKFVEVVAGRIYRGIQPGHEEDQEFLSSQGIRTQLNLRKYLGWQERSLHAKAEEHGFFYLHTGMPTLWMKPKDPEVEQALAYLNDASVQPIYVYCRLGKDRTGMIIALYRVLYEHWDACTAWKEWTSFGFKGWNDGLKDYFEERLRREPQLVGVDPNFSVGRCPH